MKTISTVSEVRALRGPGAVGEERMEDRLKEELRRCGAVMQKSWLVQTLQFLRSRGSVLSFSCLSFSCLRSPCAASAAWRQRRVLTTERGL